MKRYWTRKELALAIALGLLLVIGGCATSQSILEQMDPLDERVKKLQEQVSGLDGRVGELSDQASAMGTQLNGLGRRVSQTSSQVNSLGGRIKALRLDRQVLGELKEGVNFAVGAKTLSSEALQRLDAFLSRFKGTDDVHYIVIGHTDTMGDAERNFELGIRRAASAARHMIINKGIDAKNVNIRSQAASSSLGAVDAMDRRVEVIAYREVISPTGR